MLKIRYGLLAIVLALCFVFAVQPKRLEAQNRGSTEDTWSGKDDRLATVSTSISSTTAVVAAVSGKVINVRAITVTSDTTGVVAFQDGSGGTTIANFYLIANTPVTIYEEAFGGGLRTTSGNGLYAALGSAVLTAVVRYQAE